jgi:8-oxo-dGTP pyrophosphatase MutT (NUDIX family)
MKILDALWRAFYNFAYRLLRAWWFVRRPAYKGAYVAVWRGEELLLIQNSYRRGYTVPCGSFKRGESPREAARRELEEEVGIRVHADELEFSCEVIVPFENKRDHAYFFELRRESGAEIHYRVDNREVIWARFCPAEHLTNFALVPHLTAYLDQL